MNHRQIIIVVNCIALSTIVDAFPVNAQETFDAAKRAATIAPYVNDDTLFVARVDLARIDLVEAVKFLRPIILSDQSESDVANGAKQLASKLNEFKKLGGGELFLVGSLEEFPAGFGFVIATVQRPKDNVALVPLSDPHRKIAGILFDGDSKGPTTIKPGQAPRRLFGVSVETSEKLNDVVFAGTKSVLERLKKSKPAARADLAKAFEAAGDTTAQIVFIPSNDHRRVIREMLPRLPDAIGGGSGRVVADGLRWAAIGINAPPKTDLNLVVQLKDSEAASQVKSVISSIFLELSRSAVAKKALPKIDEILAAMTPKVKGDTLTVSLNQADDRFAAILRALTPSVSAAAAEAQRRESFNKIRQLAIAFHNYHDGFRQFPTVENIELRVRDEKAKHPFSWRVAILPYIGAMDLFKQYNFDEPWDSASNRKLISKMPDVLAGPHAALRKEGKTTYLLPVGKDTVFSVNESARFEQIKDGTANTILIVEAHPSKAVVWTKPEDFQVNEKDPLDGLKEQRAGGFITAFCDGSAHFIPDAIDAKKLKALFTKSGGEPVSGF